jgi:hypothetical protein
MSEILCVTEVKPLEGHRLRATFSDGAVKEIDLAELLSAGGVFTPIYEQREILEKVRVNPESRRSSGPARSTSIRRCSMGATSRRRAIASRAGLFEGP